MRKKLGRLLLSLSLVAALLSGCGWTFGNTEVVLDTTYIGRNKVFSINGQGCSKEEAKLYLCNYQNLYGQEFGVDLWQYDYSGMDENKSLEAYVKDITISQLANVMCLSQLAEEQKITLSNTEQKRLSKVVDEYYDSLSEEEISYIGMDKSELKEFYEKYALAQKLYTELTQGISGEVSDDEARVLLVQQIYVSEEAKALEVQQKLSEGANFESLAETYNEAETTELYLARNTYPAEADAVLFYLDTGETSPMLVLENGYYFFRCINKYVEDLTEANKSNILIQRRKEQFDNALSEFIENSEFLMNEKLWDKIKVDTSGAIQTDSFFAVFDKYFAASATDE